MQKPVFLEDTPSEHQQDFFNEIASGLLESNASISPKFLYDPLGSHLFTAITLLPEYYPTNTEKNILLQNRDEIIQALGKQGTLIDLGAGNCQKAEFLFDAIEPASYLAIDFSVEYLTDALSKLQNKYPRISMAGIGMDFTQQLNIPDTVSTTSRIFFYPGSSIGNFVTPEAEKLLREIWAHTAGGGLFIGIDLMKADEVLLAAYDDPLKITAAFNLNILRSVNSHLGSNFDIRDFEHIVEINHEEMRVELYLEANKEVLVTWPGNTRSFKKGERIHTEHSHKYSLESLQEMLNRAGFHCLKIWTDANQYFAVIYAQ
ncbi:dimethylhistidine N-methyltransferase [Polynucleobacter meluiroseus]|uniref:Dimethylhistidine N-methyltransferase n=1 Tax=Polynucleobacter meluiroseus TaxID=1938814 RepID=A0A240DYS3_9BURK|nr:L-histidine N(alpha)-methyltransferase [Polynucleobacter meluiroseus]SNX28082.1 dimethylhistidine N-methyltransferase [Polynucleobacter meluiroseus]